MDYEIRSCARWELPEIPGYTAGGESLVGDPLALKLGAELFWITNRKNDPTPAMISMKSKKEITSDKSRGSSQ